MVPWENRMFIRRECVPNTGIFFLVYGPCSWSYFSWLVSLLPKDLFAALPFPLFVERFIVAALMPLPFAFSRLNSFLYMDTAVLF